MNRMKSLSHQEVEYHEVKSSTQLRPFSRPRCIKNILVRSFRRGETKISWLRCLLERIIFNYLSRTRNSNILISDELFINVKPHEHPSRIGREQFAGIGCFQQCSQQVFPTLLTTVSPTVSPTLFARYPVGNRVSPTLFARYPVAVSYTHLTLPTTSRV